MSDNDGSHEIEIVEDHSDEPSNHDHESDLIPIIKDKSNGEDNDNDDDGDGDDEGRHRNREFQISYRHFDKKRLNEIVMAGSHDAGITSGGRNVQTQDFNIQLQAKCGVRFFDLRIAAATVPGTHNGVKRAELISFHAHHLLQKREFKERYVVGLNKIARLERTKLRAGAFGMTLYQILTDAKAFIEDNSTEFIILKFDHCTNWNLIADACVDVINDHLYIHDNQNLNTTKLEALQGKIIPLFTEQGMAVVDNMKKDESIKEEHKHLLKGILSIRNIYRPPSEYDDDFKGLQYFGKGGIPWWKPFSKIHRNKRKQRRILTSNEGINPNTMGMLYWTTTGLLESIKNRNDDMWTEQNILRFDTLWKEVKQKTEEKAFMPNIIMIDFSDKAKCEIIFELNDVMSPSA